MKDQLPGQEAENHGKTAPPALPAAVNEQRRKSRLIKILKVLLLVALLLGCYYKINDLALTLSRMMKKPDRPVTRVVISSEIPAPPPQVVDDGKVHTLGEEMSIDLGPLTGSNQNDRVKMEFVWVPPGEFMMGSVGESLVEVYESWYDETQHKVKLSKGFWMGKYEVTQEQWEKVTGRNPSYFIGAKLPVERVSHKDLERFFEQLNYMSQQIAKEGSARLPTEAEWEYACRAGTTNRYNTGDTEADLAAAGWYSGNSESKTHEVGQKKPNAWGLYDMHGNVWEWCEDWYIENYYKTSPLVDPKGPSSGIIGYVIRGGSWGYDPVGCRSAIRNNAYDGFYGIGFRIVISH